MHIPITTLPIAIGLLLIACERGDTDGGSERTRPTPDAGAVAGIKSVDPELAKAVESVAQSPMQSSQTTGGPPESGIFAPGRADAELAVTAPPKVIVGSTGTAPRVLLARQPTKAGKWPASLRLRLSAGQGSLPPLGLALSLEVAKPAAAAQSANDAGAAAPPVKVVANVTGVDASGLEMALPDNVKKVLEQLKGSALRFEVASDGGGRNFEAVLAPHADPGLEDVLKGGVDALGLMLIPMPMEPIGAGGYFMVTTRDHEATSDVVTYRMVRVERVSDTDAVLTMTSRRYAVSDRVELPQASPQPLELQRYESQGDGRIELDFNLPLPAAAQVTHQLRATLNGPQGAGPGKQLRMESNTHGRLTLDAPSVGK